MHICLDTSAMIFIHTVPRMKKLWYKSSHTCSAFVCVLAYKDRSMFLSNASMLRDAKRGKWF